MTLHEEVDVHEWKCQIFDRSCQEDVDSLERLLRSGRVRRVHDEIDSQLEDLAQSRSRRSDRAGDAQPARPISRTERDRLGRWVYYPWLESLVHVLPHAEYRELRLDRNRHKITSRELDQLSTSTVAIVGLSAGNVIARTLCLEGVCERFKLADFDVLALSNMNRLEAGVQELGLPKTVLLARRLSEINPYVDVTLWHDGITPDCLDEFLCEPPRPAVLIDECDDVPMKLLLRERARTLRIPVLMETSDRGMLDVERFDREAERPILHGLTRGVSSSAIRGLTDDERLAIVLSIVGAESISTRAAASLLEMKQTISTWPQLASDVVLGGAAMTIAVRRLLLGHPLESGRYFVDVDAILDGGPAMSLARPEERSSSAAQGSESAVSTCAQQAIDARITPFMRFVVEHGCLAPSGGNCQPWKFYAEDSRLWVVHDRVRSKNLLDADHRGSYLALGAAIENICIAAAHRGFSVAVESFPDLANSAVVARLSFSAGDEPRIHEGGRFEALRRRVTNRQRGTPVSLDERARRLLSDAAEQLGVAVHFVGERDALAQLGTIVGECDRLRFLCPALHDEMMRELRWTFVDAERTRNGLALDTLGLTTAQMAVLRLVARSDVANVLRTLDAGRALAKLSIDLLTSSSAVGLISTADLTPGDVLRAGRGFERLWLDATVLEIGFQPLGAVTALFRMLRTDAGDVLQPPEQKRLRELELAFYRLFPGVVPDSGLMLFRLSNASAPTARSLRLPLRDVLFAGRPEGLNHDA